MMPTIRTAFAGLAMLAAFTGVAQAGTITFNGSTPTSNPADFKTTNFTDTLNISKFDPALGQLTQVSFSIGGGISGTIKLESLDAAPAVLTSILSATITLERPDGSPLSFTTPTANFTDNVLNFDGAIDFGGTSGVTHADVTANGSNSSSSSTAADLALFTGASGAPGTIGLLVNTAATSKGAGAGNLVTQFSTAARADVTITYNYEDAPTKVPEPLSVAMLGAGLLSVGLMRRRAN